MRDMKILAITCLSLAVSAFRDTHPVLAFKKFTDCTSHILHVSATDLHADDLAFLPSNGVSRAYARAHKRDYTPYVEATQTATGTWSSWVCPDKMPQERYVVLNHLKEGSDRQRQLELLDGQISVEMEKEPENSLIVITSHPYIQQAIKRKRQLLEPDEAEILQALEQLSDSVDSNTEFQEHDIEVLSSAASPTTTAGPTAYGSIFAGIFQQQSSSSSSIASSTSSASATTSVKPLPSNAPISARYQLFTPNLIFATFLFFLVLFPAGWWSISALSTIESPYGLESKMSGGISSEKKDQ